MKLHVWMKFLSPNFGESIVKELDNNSNTHRERLYAQQEVLKIYESLQRTNKYKCHVPHGDDYQLHNC